MANIKKYKVKKGNVGGFGGRTFKIGDEVSEKDFPTGNAKELARLKILEEIKEKKETAAVKKLRLAAEEAQKDANDKALEAEAAEGDDKEAAIKAAEEASEVAKLAIAAYEEKK